MDFIFYKINVCSIYSWHLADVECPSNLMTYISNKFDL
jgi:hypothetical protein